MDDGLVSLEDIFDPMCGALLSEVLGNISDIKEDEGKVGDLKLLVNQLYL